jgi:hypothetical protein
MWGYRSCRKYARAVAEEERHVTDVLVVDLRWLSEYVKLWKPEFLKKQFLNLPLVLDFTRLD